MPVRINFQYENRDENSHFLLQKFQFFMTHPANYTVCLHNIWVLKQKIPPKNSPY